jgi:hypothetical protein
MNKSAKDPVISRRTGARAPLQLQFQLLGLLIAPSKPSATRLDATDGRHQPTRNASLCFDLQSDLLFVGPAGGQLNHWAIVLLSQSRRSLADAIGEADGERFEVFPQNTGPLEVELHDRGIVEAAQSALQSESVPAVHNTNDVGLMALYKGVRDIAQLGIESLLHNAFLPEERCPVSEPSASLFIRGRNSN